MGRPLFLPMSKVTMIDSADDKPGRDKPAGPTLAEAGEARATAREARRAAALRANLSRRKSQSRARQSDGEGPVASQESSDPKA